MARTKKEIVNSALKRYQNERKYNTEYNRKVYRRFDFKLRKDTDADIIEFLENTENRNEYLRKLIRKDMEEK